MVIPMCLWAVAMADTLPTLRMVEEVWKEDKLVKEKDLCYYYHEKWISDKYGHKDRRELREQKICFIVEMLRQESVKQCWPAGNHD